MEISQRLFGLHPNGTEIFAYEIANSQNISICVIDYGATLTSVKTPDRNGKLAEINLGFDSLEQYLAPHPYLGATIGRYANRIASGHFTIDFTEYRLTCNDNGINHIHGGAAGFDKQIWQGEMFEQQDKAGVLFTYLSVDGEEGYPGNLNVRVIYSLNEANELKIEYFARTDKITPVNLTNHAYWNLSGVGNNKIKDHILQLNCNHYIPVNGQMIPIGEIKAVAGTPFDFTQAKAVGKDMDKVKYGYDYCYVVNRTTPGLVLAARLYEQKSGRGLDLYTTKPGVHLYTGNHIGNVTGRDGCIYRKFDAICLETEYYPDSVNHTNFPSCLLKPGQKYEHATLYELIIR